MQQINSQQPFFARFLESQKKQEQSATPGTRQQNDPWPVPVPSHPFKDGPYTDKYPSDGDEDF